MSGKGIIVQPGLDIQEHKSLKYLGTVHPNKLKNYLLYWDRIDIPTSSLMEYSTPSHERFLEDHGVLVHTFHDNGETFLPKTDITSLEYAISQRNKENPGQWSLATTVVSDKYIQEDTKKLVGNGLLEMKLHEALPIPSPDASFQDILEFKKQRKDELDELHMYLDRLYRNILSSPDTDRGIYTSTQELKRCVEQFKKSSDRPWLKSFSSRISVSLSLGTLFHIANDFTTHSYSDILLELAGCVSASLIPLSKNPYPADIKAVSYIVNVEKNLQF